MPMGHLFIMGASEQEISFKIFGQNFIRTIYKSLYW